MTSRVRDFRSLTITQEVAERIIALRRKYPLYGPVMLADWLRLHEPETRWPAPSSIEASESRALEAPTPQAGR